MMKQGRERAYLKKTKRMVAACMSALLLAPGMTGFAGAAAGEPPTPAGESYYTVGRFQPENDVLKTSLSGEGQAKINIDAAVLVDIREFDPADLAVQMDMRVTRHDGITGADSLKWVRNGQLTLADSSGAQVFKAGSPVQQGVPLASRLAGEWMTVTFPLASMQSASGKLANLTLFDYNDIPKQAEQTGINMEVRNARIVDTTRDADGNERVIYEKGAFTQIEGTYTENNSKQLYADWTPANVTPIDVSAERGRYRLTLSLAFASNDASVSAADAWQSITVKLRSSDVEDKEGDTDKSNKEHNAGWDFKPADITGSRDQVELSIPLDFEPTNRRGVIDWADIQKMICYATLNANAGGHVKMMLSNARIVDWQALEKLREQLKAGIDTPQKEADFHEDGLAAYKAAKAAAEEVYNNTNAGPDALQGAITALQRTFLATDAEKESLKGWVEKEVDENLFTADSVKAYREAAAAGAALLTDKGATKTAVNATEQAVKEAWYALVWDDGAIEIAYGDIDGKNGVLANDALLALQAATNKITLDAAQILAADVDGKDGVTANDALMILQYATKKITAFPAGEDLSSHTAAIENPDPLTTCNPVDISYMIQRGKTNDDGTVSGVYIESADPAVVVYKGEYWLFASHGEGYWVSDDLADWEFIQVDLKKQPEFARYAPATCVVGDTLYLTHSESGHMLKTTNPRDPNAWEDIGKPDGWMDPGMFYDDPATGGDGYVYLYKGLSHRNPIQVVKLDPNDNMKKVDGPYDCAWPDQLNRGFEVPGDTNTNYDKNDTMEGAWPVKYGGKYYLTCAVPGTADASYSDNCFVSDHPMGPFVFCENSPISWKNTGFTQGAGHGAMFEDLNGHWWKVDTCRVNGFNRRLVLIPAKFDENGDAYTNTVRSDYPFYVPGESEDPFNVTGPGWNLLSYGKEATASTNASSAGLAFNETMTNAWVAQTGDAGEWLQVDLGKLYGVWSVQVNFADKDVTVGGRDNDFAYRYLMEFSQDGQTWIPMADRTGQTENRQHEYIEFKDKVGARYIRITNKGEVPGGGKFAVNGLRVFGEGGGRAPMGVDMSTVSYERREDNNRSIGLSWSAAPGAQGYIIRYGLSPDKLYTHYQVIDSRSLVINSLNRGVDYYFAIDSFNENGVTMGTETIFAEATEPLQPGYDVDGTNPALINQAAGLTVHEAEKATFGGQGVKVQYEVRASGPYALHGMGGADTFAEFAKVDGGSGGNATLRISYSAQEDSKAAIKVGGKAVGELTLPKTSGWPTYATVDMELSGLTEGETNTIRVEGVGRAFHLDWIQVIYKIDSGEYEPGDIIGVLGDPLPLEDYILYEAEASVFGNTEEGQYKVTIASDAGASGGQSLHSMDTKGSFAEFRKVDGGAGGRGILRFCYSCGNAKGEPTILVNGEQLGAYSLDNTGGWPTFKLVQIALDGLNPDKDNVVRVEGGKSGFNLDWIQVIPDDKGDHYGQGNDSDPFDGVAAPRQAAGYPVYEAEDAAIGNGANVANDVKASGGKSVHSMEKPDAYVEFTGVDGGPGGEGRLRLSYCEGNASGKFRLLVNGELVEETTLSSTGDWTTFMMREFPLTGLKAGAANTIRLECGGAGYNPDWIQVLY